ncbi:bifunctional UDP-N-acetylglucosamine transferase and deubiquitinase ALG13 isoform X1 [Labeo rohita]|uniref:Bifunctional UDP-N-acetylglucosamine transferase and deubiquitinase ALG13 isoform X1 n=1 Tax=Labeo rohita TaxID=84645 RepID=A0A498LGR5_LABRO|nr:bifunctional UDP-N-acetylglucosamine transferase and deubiquitinase ALG13 isoform X1 [Labeo rohita]RXN05884.1 bifunctional UDP-N-acetylglucosamine transferase and deubiquitinase ALG13 isoform X1 [Labeo rohita]
MHSLNKEYLSCVPEPGEETQDIEGSITFYEIEETDESAFSPIPGQAVSSPMVPGATAYWVPRVPSPIPPSVKQPMTSSEEDPDERSTAGDQGEYAEDYIYSAAEAGYQSPSVYAAAAESTTNLWYQQSYWHSMVHMQQVYPQSVAEAQFQPYPSTVPAADHTVPQAYPDPVRMCPHPQGDVPGNGTPLAMENPPAVVPGAVFYPLVQEQCGQPPLHPSYEPYMPVLSTTYHYLTPWTPGAGPHPRVHHATYCPSSSHPPVNYITAPTHPSHLSHSQFV